MRQKTLARVREGNQWDIWSRDGGVADHLIPSEPTQAAFYLPVAFACPLLSPRMAAPEENEGSLVRSLKDLFAGAVGGVAQVLIGEYFFEKGWKLTLILISRPAVRY